MLKTLEVRQLRHGDILHCYSTGWLAKAIQWFTKSRVNHTAIVIKVDSTMLIADSQANGTNIKTVENWIKKYNYEYTIHRPLYLDVELSKHITNKVFMKMGITGYDFASLIIWQPWYIITGRWKGKREAAAESRMYCSEFVAWIYNMPTWWSVSPQAFKDWLFTTIGFKYIE